METPLDHDHTAIEAKPGFYLCDDACGRFVIDSEFGFVSVADESLVEREFGATHTARLRVIEPSGASYELPLRLRITGRIPQMAGGEENDFLLALAGAPIPETPRSQSEPTTIAWSAFAAARGGAPASVGEDETAPLGALRMAPPLPVCRERIELAFDGAPSPAARDATWAIC